ncbi:unnamed protein product [Ectocarpus sp. 6 AP-2014]
MCLYPYTHVVDPRTSGTTTGSQRTRRRAEVITFLIKVAVANASTIRSKKKNEKRAVARKKAYEARKAEAEAARGAEAVEGDEPEEGTTVGGEGVGMDVDESEQASVDPTRPRSKKSRRLCHRHGNNCGGLLHGWRGRGWRGRCGRGPWTDEEKAAAEVRVATRQKQLEEEERKVTEDVAAAPTAADAEAIAAAVGVAKTVEESSEENADRPCMACGSDGLEKMVLCDNELGGGRYCDKAYRFAYVGLDEEPDGKRSCVGENDEEGGEEEEEEEEND